MHDEFCDPSLRTNFVDKYHIRVSIFDALKQNRHALEGKLLDVGCGQMPYRLFILSESAVQKYIGLDLEDISHYEEHTPDLTWNGRTIPLSDGEIDSAMATEVLEHCPDPDSVTEEVFRVLKPGGKFFFTVPFLWPLHDNPYDEYRYTPFALERILSQAGFTNIELTPHGGWDASLAQMLGLWVRRRPMSSRRRRWLSRLLKPVISFLLDKDRVPDWRTERAMITGLSGLAAKPVK